MNTPEELDIVQQVETITQQAVLEFCRKKDFDAVARAYLGLGELFEAHGIHGLPA